MQHSNLHSRQFFPWSPSVSHSPYQSCVDFLPVLFMANCGWLTTNPLICMGWYAFTFVDSKCIHMTIQSQWQPIRVWIPSLHHRLWVSTISIPVIPMSSAHHANEILNWNTQYFMCGSVKYPLEHCKYGQSRRKGSSTLDSLQKH